MDEFGTFFQPLMYPENAHYAQKVNFYKNAPKNAKIYFWTKYGLLSQCESAMNG